MSELDDCEKPVETTTRFAGGGAGTAVVVLVEDVVVEAGAVVVDVVAIVGGLATVVSGAHVLVVELDAAFFGTVQDAALVSWRSRARWPATKRARRRGFL
ncbi:MAG: hypothetical protein ACXWYS_05310 [Gaiellaceae bacterium]